MDVHLDKVADKGSPGGRFRGKYLTLALLLVWVAAVFTFTFFKFSGGGR